MSNMTILGLAQPAWLQPLWDKPPIPLPVQEINCQKSWCWISPEPSASPKNAMEIGGACLGLDPHFQAIPVIRCHTQEILVRMTNIAAEGW